MADLTEEEQRARAKGAPPLPAMIAMNDTSGQYPEGRDGAAEGDAWLSKYGPKPAGGIHADVLTKAVQDAIAKRGTGMGDVRMADRSADVRGGTGMGDVKTADVGLNMRPPPPEKAVPPLPQGFAAGIVSRTATPPTDAPGASDTTQAPHAGAAPPAVAQADAPPPDDLPAPPMPPDGPPAAAKPPPGVAGSAGDAPPKTAPMPVAPPDRSAQLEAALRAAQEGRGDPYAPIASRFIEDMRTARTGGAKDYRIADDLERQNASAAAAPMRAYTAQTAQDKASLDRQNILSQIAKRGASDVKPPTELQLALTKKANAETAAIGTKTAALPFPTAPVDPDVARQRKATADLAEYKLAHKDDPKTGNTGAADRATATAAARVTRNGQVDLQKLAGVMTKQAPMYGALVQFNDTYPGAFGGEGKDLTGESALGLLDRLKSKLVPQWLPEEKQRFARMAENFTDLVKRARTGAQANSAEDATYGRILGTSYASDPAAFQQALRDFADAAHTQLETAAAGFTPETITAYEGGPDGWRHRATPNAPFFKTLSAAKTPAPGPSPAPTSGSADKPPPGQPVGARWTNSAGVAFVRNSSGHWDKAAANAP